MLFISTEKYQSDLLNVELEIYQDEGGAYWFHGATLCDVFDLSNPSQTIQRHVDDDWRKKFPAKHGKDSWYVLEPGLYQLLHASNHPAAKRFQRWVYSEVLPKLRAKGGYIMPTASSEQLEALQKEVATLQSDNTRLRRRIPEAVASPAATRRTVKQFLEFIGDGTTNPRTFWKSYAEFRLKYQDYFTELLEKSGYQGASAMIRGVDGYDTEEERERAHKECKKKGWEPDAHMFVVYYEKHEFPSWTLEHHYSNHFLKKLAKAKKGLALLSLDNLIADKETIPLPEPRRTPATPFEAFLDQAVGY